MFVLVPGSEGRFFLSFDVSIHCVVRCVLSSVGRSGNWLGRCKDLVPGLWSPKIADTSETAIGPYI